MKYMSNLIKHMTVIWKWPQWSYSKANDHPNMQSIKYNSIRINACPTHDQCKIHEVYASRNKILLGHKSMMRWEQQSIGDTKHNSKHHKATRKQAKSKTRFPHKNCLLPLGICISPMTFSPYECARGRITPSKSVHMSHIEMTIQTCILSDILSPFLSRIDKTIKRKEGKKRRYEQVYYAWGVQDEWENKAQTKNKDILKHATKHKIYMSC